MLILFVIIGVVFCFFAVLLVVEFLELRLFFFRFGVYAFVQLLVETSPVAEPLQLLQFHGNESASFCESFGVPYIKALRVKDGMDIPELVRSYPTAKAILLDT